MTPEAEKFNGWAAMLGFVAAFGAYATTGQIIPGFALLSQVGIKPKHVTSHISDTNATTQTCKNLE